MLLTPSTSHVNYNQVYEPAEDSFLLLDTLSSSEETQFFRNRFPVRCPSPLVLEVGTGSGVILAFINAHSDLIIGRSDVVTLGVDLNQLASVATKKTVEANAKVEKQAGSKPGLFLACLTGDLATAIKPEAVDILIFNPPYVPTESVPQVPHHIRIGVSKSDFARDSHLLSLSTDGGANGMEVTERLLSQLPYVLSQRGIAYILLGAQNKPEEVISRVRNWPFRYEDQWHAERVGSSGKKAGWERLCVIRIWQNRGPKLAGV